MDDTDTDTQEPTCAKKVVKYLVMILKFIFLLVGIPTFAIGLWPCFDQRRRALLTATEGSSALMGVTTVKLPGAYRVYILPVAGALLMVSGPLGYRATTKESKCMLGFFFVSLLAILVANMDIGIWVLSNKDKMRCCDPAAIDQLFFGMLQLIGVVGLLIAVMVLGIILIMLLYFVIKCLQKTKCTFAVERD